MALFARHTAATGTPERNAISRLLSPERMARARALGAAMRLGCDLSGRSPALLGRSGLVVEDEAVVLTADAGWADMLLGEQTAKRASTLADTLDLGLRMGR